MNKVSDIATQVFDVPQDIRDVITHTCEKWQIPENSVLAGIMTNYVNDIVGIALDQLDAMDELSEVTGQKFSKVNVDEVKNIDPAQFDDPEVVAEAMLKVLKQEAKKLVTTATYLSDVRENLSESEFDRSEDPKLQKDIYFAQRIAGTTVKQSMFVFRERCSHRMEYTLSHTPQLALKDPVGTTVERINQFLPPEKQMEL